MRRRNINEVLGAAQARLTRLTPAEAAAAVHEGATLVDTRSNDLRFQDGVILEAIHVPLSVLEWRVDAASGFPSPALAGHRPDDPHLPGRLLIEPRGAAPAGARVSPPRPM